MRHLINLTVTVMVLSALPPIMGESPTPETSLSKEIQETSVTACWIEYPLRRVFSDLEGVKPRILDADSTISSTDLDTLITLEVIDVGFEQVLREILSPIGLAYKVESGTVIVGKSPKPDEKITKAKGFFSKWQQFNRLSLPNQISLPTEMLLPNKAQKRHGWICLNGRIEEPKDLLEFTKNKKIHRWISSRPEITITKHYIPNQKSQSRSIVNHRFVPVVELVSDPDIPKEQ